MNNNNRNIAFDVIKGIAIIAVVLYHYGLCPNGYLGVDIFLVIAGYFTSKSLYKKNVGRLTVAGGGKYIINRILRLTPLLLLAEIILLLHGFLMMMPDDFENVSQSIIASNFFSNNILEDITTKNYWDITNEYKPLMHTWYLGILMQFYVIIVIIDLLIAQIKGNKVKVYIIFWFIISIASLCLYLSHFPQSSKFYEIPFRLFEFGFGCLTFYITLNKFWIPNKRMSSTAIIIAYLSLLVILFANHDFIRKQDILLFTVFISGILTYLLPHAEFSNNKVWFNKPLAVIGAASFSFFIWHQIVFAMARYSFVEELQSMTVFFVVMLIVGILTYLSYRFIERAKFTHRFIVSFVSLFIFINASAFVIYMRAGIFYDIPELEVTTDNIKKGQWGEYCDKGFRFDKSFENSEKPKWMVVGNSFGRDFVNIISESSIADSVDLSYASEIKSDNHRHRIGQADIVFISTLGLSDKLVNEIKSLMSPNSRFVIVGEKNFGVNNGLVFRKRKQPEYFQSAVRMEAGYDERNNQFKSQYSSNYLDLIELVKLPNGKVRVFNEEGRFISQDCRHLTKAGAKFFACKIDWSQFTSQLN